MEVRQDIRAAGVVSARHRAIWSLCSHDENEWTNVSLHQHTQGCMDGCQCHLLPLVPIIRLFYDMQSQGISPFVLKKQTDTRTQSPEYIFVCVNACILFMWCPVCGLILIQSDILKPFCCHSPTQRNCVDDHPYPWGFWYDPLELCLLMRVLPCPVGGWVQRG